VNGDYSRESSVTSMLNEPTWPALQQRRTNMANPTTKKNQHTNDNFDYTHALANTIIDICNKYPKDTI